MRPAHLRHTSPVFRALTASPLPLSTSSPLHSKHLAPASKSTLQPHSMSNRRESRTGHTFRSITGLVILGKVLQILVLEPRHIALIRSSVFLICPFAGVAAFLLEPLVVALLGFFFLLRLGGHVVLLWWGVCCMIAGNVLVGMCSCSLIL